MSSLRLRHDNDDPRCPVIGADDIPGEEYYQILSLRFNVTLAKKLSAKHDVTRIEPLALARWLQYARILEDHVGHLPANAGHGIMVTLPAGCGMPLIDGNHRATRALRLGEPFSAAVLSEAETLELLRLSMNPAIADQYWERMRRSKPHPDDH
jgi:hypothetical protein